ncbi:MAG TPA: hypothetical protein VJ020_11065 [Anaerolineales bacterium]|nr:hypothetical protein [Anaerolineales bacterium]
MKRGPCPKCGSTEIVTSAEVRDHDRNSHRPLGVFVKFPKDKVEAAGKTHESSELRAWVCGKGGYTELYSTSFKALLAAKKNGTARP